MTRIFRPRLSKCVECMSRYTSRERQRERERVWAKSRHKISFATGDICVLRKATQWFFHSKNPNFKTGHPGGKRKVSRGKRRGAKVKKIYSRSKKYIGRIAIILQTEKKIVNLPKYFHLIIYYFFNWNIFKYSN